MGGCLELKFYAGVPMVPDVICFSIDLAKAMILKRVVVTDLNSLAGSQGRARRVAAS